MKRIAMISYHTCPLSAQEGKETGGMNIFVKELATQLAKNGTIVDVFTRSQDTTSPKIVEVNKNFRVIHIDAGPQVSVNKKQLTKYLPEFVRGMKQYIVHSSQLMVHGKSTMNYEPLTMNNTYDILDCHYYLSGLIGLKLQFFLKKRIPIFITFHTLALMKNLVAKTEQEKEPVYRIFAEIELVKRANKVISTGESDAEYLEYLYECPKEKISVITPGVDTNRFKPMKKHEAREYIAHSSQLMVHGKSTMNHKLTNPEPTKIILFVGRIEPLKGLDVLMYAMKILLKRKINCSLCLWIVGGDVSQKIELWPEELKKLEKLRTLMGITSEVKFIGRKNPEELPYYYNAADIVVMPSQYESFGMSALEAMACGTPVITTDVTGVSEILDDKHQSLITSANDPLQLAEKIENLLENPKLYEQKAMDVYEKVQDCSWEKVAKKVSKLFEI